MFKVYKECDSVEEKKELFFKLEEDSNLVRLVLVDKHGKKPQQCNILKIQADGLHVCSSVTEDAPFKLDADSCIRIGESY